MISESITALERLLSKPQKIVIIGHKNPDGDAIGSCQGWGLFLKKNGHTVNVVMPNDFPDFLKWVPNIQDISIFSNDTQKVENLIGQADLIFTLDFNTLSRVGKDFQVLLENANKPFVMIDHHLAPDDYAELQFSHPEYGSTAELVYECISGLDKTNLIDKDIASCLYLGIMTDTGSFKFPSTTARTHEIIADFKHKGIDSYNIHVSTYDSNSYSRLKLLGVAMKNMHYLQSYRTAYIHLSQQELDHHNFQKGDTEGFVNYGLTIKDAVFAAIFKEDKVNNVVKISFRSKGNFDVNTFARTHFDGGGHKNAAGGKSDLSLQKTIEKFVNLLDDYKMQLDEAH